MNGLIAVPVYNEAATLPRVVEKLTDRFPRDNLLFVDDGSVDGSREILEASGLTFLSHPINLGYHEALRTAMEYVLSADFEFVAFFDADGQHRIEDLEKLIRVFGTNRYDFILGSRYLNKERIGFTLRTGSTRLFSLVTSLLVGTRVTDVTCGLKLVSREYLPLALSLPTEDMHAEMIMGLYRSGARYHEESIDVLPRETGDSMYSLVKSLLYPAKTFVCLLGELLFEKKVRPGG